MIWQTGFHTRAIMHEKPHNLRSNQVQLTSATVLKLAQPCVDKPVAYTVRHWRIGQWAISPATLKIRHVVSGTVFMVPFSTQRKNSSRCHRGYNPL